MRCECCNKNLSDKEATARYAPTSKDETPRYVNMCTECQGFLPPSVKILTRSDLQESREFSDDDSYDDFVDNFYLNEEE